MFGFGGRVGKECCEKVKLEYTRADDINVADYENVEILNKKGYYKW